MKKSLPVVPYLQAPLPTPFPTRFAVFRLDLVEYEIENELDAKFELDGACTCSHSR